LNVEADETNSLDDAEMANAEKAAQAQLEQEKMDEITALFASYNGNLQDVMQLSRLQKIKWRFEMYPTSADIATRLFSSINSTKSPYLPIAVLDFIIKQIQDEFPVTKQTYDFAEVISYQTACARCTPQAQNVSVQL
jgi:hypothetical protein